MATYWGRAAYSIDHVFSLYYVYIFLLVLKAGFRFRLLQFLVVVAYLLLLMTQPISISQIALLLLDSIAKQTRLCQFVSGSLKETLSRAETAIFNAYKSIAV